MLIKNLDWESPADRTLPAAAPPGWYRQWCCDRSARMVTSPVRSGSWAARFQLNRNDPDVSSSKRAEITAPNPQVSVEEIERWYGFSVYLPSSYTADPKSAESVFQWHQHSDVGGSPPLALLTNNGGWEVFQARPGYEKRHALGAYTPERWTDWVFHVAWSPGTGGLLEVWQDGALKLRLGGQNKGADGHAVYPKFGIYKWDWKSQPQRSGVDERVLFIDSVRIADENGSYGEVDPAEGSRGPLLLRPRADAPRWSVHGAGSAGEALARPVVQPTPVDSTKYIWARSPGAVADVSFGTAPDTLDMTRKGRLWLYANTGADTRLHVAVAGGGLVLSQYEISEASGFGWRAVEFAQEAARGREIDARFEAFPGGDSNVRAAYLELTGTITS